MGDELKVEIADVTYSLVELPRSDTQLVVSEREKLLGKIDLKALVVDLGHVGKLIRVAYNGVTAAGPKFTELQIQVQDLGYDVTKLCDKSAITVAKFKRACATILSDLQTTYQYLLDNFEDMALDTLESVSELSGQMAKAAQDLQKDFDDEATKVRKVANETQRSRGKQAIVVQDMKKEEEVLRIKHEAQIQVLKDARKAEQEAEDRYLDYEAKEDEAIASLGDDGSVITQLMNALTSKMFGIRAFGEDPEARKQKVTHWKQKKIEALEKRQKQESLRKEAYKQLTDFAVSIGNCKGEKEMAEAVVDALHKAIKGLKMLAALMMQAALFWTQMQEHCKALGEDKMKQTVEKALKYTEARRHELWTSDNFKRKAVRFYAGWVALDNVCGEYMLAIQETQKNLYKYITENPSYEDAERNVKQLAVEFQKELEEEQKAIAERDFETEEEIRSLKED